MKIAILAPLWKKIPPDKYGGSESIVADLVSALTELGHKVTTFACNGSSVSGELAPVIERPMFELTGGFNWSGIQPYEFLSFFEFAKRAGEFDIVHNHMGFHPVAFAPLLPIPMVTTLHSSLEPDFPYLAERFKSGNFVSISNAQRSLAPYLNYVAMIYHGIDTSKFDPNFSDYRDYLVFIGSLTPHKGVDTAVKIASDMGEKLIIAGDTRPEFQEFVDKKVMPFVGGQNIKFLGEIGHEEKNKILAGAKAFVFPVRWNEAFGLVIAESLACGTPVVAFGNGSVPEIIKDGKTGFVVKNEDEMRQKIRQVSEISREACRQEAVERFDKKTMAGNYIELYKKLINQKK